MILKFKVLPSKKVAIVIINFFA